MEEKCTCGGTAKLKYERVDEDLCCFCQCSKCQYRSTYYVCGPYAEQDARQSWNDAMKHVRHAYYGPLYAKPEREE